MKHIPAIDVSQRMIEIAPGKAEAGKVDNVTFELVTIEALSVPSRSFDAVLGLSIPLRLLEDRDALLTKVHGLC